MDAFGFIKPGLASPRSSVSNTPFGASVRATPVPTKPRARSRAPSASAGELLSSPSRFSAPRPPTAPLGGTFETRRLIRTRGGERESKGSVRKCTQAFELNKKATSRGCARVRVCVCFGVLCFHAHTCSWLSSTLYSVALGGEVSLAKSRRLN